MLGRAADEVKATPGNPAASESRIRKACDCGLGRFRGQVVTARQADAYFRRPFFPVRRNWDSKAGARQTGPRFVAGSRWGLAWPVRETGWVRRRLSPCGVAPPAAGWPIGSPNAPMECIGALLQTESLPAQYTALHPPPGRSRIR